MSIETARIAADRDQAMQAALVELPGGDPGDDLPDGRPATSYDESRGVAGDLAA